jgi:hypothetical protein
MAEDKTKTGMMQPTVLDVLKWEERRHTKKYEEDMEVFMEVLNSLEVLYIYHILDTTA